MLGKSDIPNIDVNVKDVGLPSIGLVLVYSQLFVFAIMTEMKRVVTVVAVVIVVVVVGVLYLLIKKEPTEEKPAILEEKIMGTLSLTSPVFKNNGFIPSKYTCDGDDKNPPLEIRGVPENTESLVLIVDDPDAPVPPVGGWDHWVVWNIDPKVASIPENSVPQGGVQGKTSFGNQKYGGPCPPRGAHRYFFKLYALDTNLDLPANATKKEVEKVMEGHIIDRVELVGLYERQ